MPDREPKPELERAEPLSQELREEIAGHVHRLLGSERGGTFPIHDRESVVSLFAATNGTVLISVEGEIAPEEIRGKDFDFPPQADQAVWYPIKNDPASFRSRIRWRFAHSNPVTQDMGRELRDYLELFRR